MKITFVCTGNTCRSPMAEGIARALLPEHEIASRGITSIAGDPIAKHTKTLLEADGYPVKSTADILKSEDLEADLILTMTHDHAELIRLLYGAHENVMTLTEFVGEAGDVKDPFGSNFEVYEATYNELKALIHMLKSKIPEA
ncbi:low molecular weight protein arginine phosphatase [Staphylococcus canis]|uniref:Low molecular weight protein-tyrosine-phosphatase PtpB n=1 Tax=Staphylococcus canis TaxID=2724942 RepID=A0ABS0T9Y2_9STAP|nr:low molecular weight protein arginine phosphatase [Staphylococcus canis]MBI5975527.1 low molecular weight protein arginine phosphatase [Staphylococcus canis]